MRTHPKRSKAIGGYLEMQLPKGEEYYPSLIKLNTGRNALEYILKVNKYSLIYIPYYTCEVLLEPIKKSRIPYSFYTIDQNLDPVIDFYIAPTECFLYTNYFGIKQLTVQRLSGQMQNLVIDNSQAFFSEPLAGIDTFYSCRKFFGVPDGAYLQSNTISNLKFERDVSYNRVSHLVKSIDLDIEDGYEDFIENNMVLTNNPIKTMSVLTQSILSGIDYEDCARIRNRNFRILHQALSGKNKLVLNPDDSYAPMSYPFLIEKNTVQKKLINKRIYIPTYWPNVLKWTTPKMFENYLCIHLLALPIDHRLNDNDMNRIISYINLLI
ncbi:hypothetical protein ADIARSV_2984 [Arcticibacter svalbardensis MN12-7]|uniref:DegT/DnrJ/EryC1/StrS aminotransferase family protein n=1 Tax=Arcticibacter svalbardensis MN12-7 TaxID=1150600 RepID=R9GPS7_9SPHI|nr:hypothetical protein [Arcticibacter svalbardensis]EOR93847.1 hypothetical protein ADIARSV_2984 [Arcticibacter svalbardensis MN12-7]